MKKVLFLLLSALLAGTAFCSNLSRDFIAKVTNNVKEVSVKEWQKQSLILEQPANEQMDVNWHYSHSSHGSHSSHSSHSSHASHYSSRYQWSVVMMPQLWHHFYIHYTISTQIYAYFISIRIIDSLFIIFGYLYIIGIIFAYIFR